MKYQEPHFEIIMFWNEDVIKTSPLTPEGGGDNDDIIQDGDF